ncbi:hypothetical protein JHK86_025140 [Glycine max]|nr:hypothetical protein JHK86_025140 [Glycine max]
MESSIPNGIFGMSSALATLCGQAFGAGQIQSTCIYVQRSWIILTATCTILLPIFVYATPILKLLGQDEGIAELAGRYSIQGGCMLWLWLCIRLIGAEKNGVDFDGWHLGICGPLLSKPSIICNELLRAMFAKIFTDSEDMILADSDLAHLLGVTIVLNSASQVMSGVAIGSRWQVMVGYINLACYYIVGLPIGIFLGFKLHLGVKRIYLDSKEGCEYDK